MTCESSVYKSPILFLQPAGLWHLGDDFSCRDLFTTAKKTLLAAFDTGCVPGLATATKPT